MWELSEESPNTSNYKFFFVRCMLCKVPIGVVDYYDTHTKLDRIEKTLLTLGNSLTGTLQVIGENIRRLFLK